MPNETVKGAPLVVRLYSLLRQRDIQVQAIFVIIVALIIWAIDHTASQNNDQTSVNSGFGFLWEKASFELGESLISYSAGDTYMRAFEVGILNTLKVAVLGIFLSTVVGLLIALGQLSPSRVVVWFCRSYIEVIRNVPLLLQLIFWHTFLTRSLPIVRNAASPMEGVFISNRGLYLPSIQPQPIYGYMGLLFLCGIGAAILIKRWFNRSNTHLHPGRWMAAAIFLPSLIIFFAAGAPLEFDYPKLTGFNFTGGMAVTPEYTAMLLGLTLYTGSFNAEIIRGGILGISKGQSEAGYSLGLSRNLVMRLILIPQALRIIIPPMTNSYLNLTKESSLAVAIGYPEVVRVANITLAETNQSIECISIIMLIYLTLSLITSAILNWFNARAKVESR